MKSLHPRYIALRHFMQVELLIASVLPVAALLMLGTIGAEFIPGSTIGPFLLALVLCTLGAFIGELSIILFTQRASRKQLIQFITVCQDYLAGNTTRRTIVQGDDELAALAQTLNTLLDIQAAKAQNPSQDQRGIEAEMRLLVNSEIEHLVRVISPVLDGDLRVRAEVTSDTVGVAADIYNYLIEEMTLLIREVQSTANQVLSATRDLLDRSIELAQTTEMQMLSLSQATEKVETLIAFIQRLTNTLQIGTETTRDLYRHLYSEEKALPDVRQNAPADMESHTPQENDTDFIDVETTTRLQPLEPEGDDNIAQMEHLLPVLREGIQHQKRLFETIDYSAQEHTSTAENLIEEVYQLAQHTHQSSMSVLGAAERISALAVVAEKLRDSVATFKLPAEKHQSKQHRAAKSPKEDLSTSLSSSLR